MTTVEKRMMLEIVTQCVRGDVLTNKEAVQILEICEAAAKRAEGSSGKDE